jgi:hypothetical protein
VNLPDLATTSHVILAYNEVEDSIEVGFHGTSPALAREMVHMANELLESAMFMRAVEDE